LLSYLPLEHLSEVLWGLSTVTAPKLGAAAIKGALDKINLDPNLIDEVFMGNGSSWLDKLLQAAIFAGLTVACTTINKVCASGMKAVMLTHKQYSDAEIVVAGGMENMSMIHITST
jgi:acetyl-CoA C-acetyltransferase